MSRGRFLILSAAACLLLSTAARADRVILNDGRVYEGRVTEAADVVYVQTRHGRLPAIPKTDVRQIIYGDAPPTAEDTTVPGPSGELDASAFPQAERPEPIIFVLMRRLQSMEPGIGSARVRESLRLWQAAAQDGVMQSGRGWIRQDEIQRRRTTALTALREANDLLRQARDLTGRADRSDRARQTQLRTQGLAKLRSAAMSFPGPVVSGFLVGQGALLQDDYAGALRAFDACVKAQPLVAAFYQGRAAAFDGLSRPVDALRDYVTLLNMTGDPQSGADLADALQRMPASTMRSRPYQDAQALLERHGIPPPSRQPRSTGTDRGFSWRMPGGAWRAQAGTVAEPLVDAFVASKAVAVPVAPSVLLVDAAVVAGADVLLLEVAPGLLVPAEPVRLRTPRGSQAPAVAAVLVEGFAFTPVPFDATVAAARGEELVLHAHSAPEELDPDGPRRALVRVLDVPADGAPAVSAELRPGESAGPLLTLDGRLVTFLAGRADPAVDNGGAHVVLPPADLAPLVADAQRSGAPRNSSPRTRAGAEPQTVEGTLFTLHAIAGRGRTLR